MIVTLFGYIISQFSGGSISKGSELQVEVAEFLWRNVQVRCPILAGNRLPLHKSLTYSCTPRTYTSEVN